MQSLPGKKSGRPEEPKKSTPKVPEKIWITSIQHSFVRVRDITGINETLLDDDDETLASLSPEIIALLPVEASSIEVYEEQYSELKEKQTKTKEKPVIGKPVSWSLRAGNKTIHYKTPAAQKNEIKIPKGKRIIINSECTSGAGSNISLPYIKETSRKIKPRLRC